MDAKQIMNELRKPFKPDELEWMVKTVSEAKLKGLALPYVSNRAIQKRLDDVVGIENWKNEFIEWKDKDQLCGISIRINNEWITKYDGAADTNIDGTKGGISGAMKRAAVQWGIGRYLYNIPPIWVDVEVASTSKTGKKTYRLSKRPSLPKEFLPENYTPGLNNWNPEPDTPTNKSTPAPILNCLESFKTLGVSQGDIENYFHLEIDMLQETEMATLREIYQSIKSGKKNKEDYFFSFEGENKTERSPSTLKLEDTLKGG